MRRLGEAARIAVKSGRTVIDDLHYFAEFTKWLIVLYFFMQNTSHAVMAQRTEPRNSPDDFPTPPWATRALIEYVLPDKGSSLSGLNCLEPACGAGHMATVLKEHFREVQASDAFHYGYGTLSVRPETC